MNEAFYPRGDGSLSTDVD